MQKIKALLIDDEPLARQIIRDFLYKYDDIEIIGECSNGFDGYKSIQDLSPDLVFLDIKMPKLTGFEMLELLEDPPLIVFSTAYDEFAIKAFEQNAIDYLLKPYSEDRFSDTIKKVISKFQSEDDIKNASKRGETLKFERHEELSRLAVKVGSNIHIIPIEEINYIQAQDDYVEFFTANGKYLKQGTMKYYESLLPKNDFFRVHRSYIANIRSIVRMELMGKDSHVIFLKDDTQLPVSRANYTGLKKLLNL